VSYYNRPMGDYSTGGYGYPQGDPGLFSFLGKIVRKAAPVLGRFFGPVGTVVGAALGAREATKALIPAPPPVPGAAAFPGGGIPAAAGAFVGAGIAGYQGAVTTAGACPAGYHLRKDKRLPAKCVRNRRMNIANPRALRRGMRRVKGFEKLARRTISFTRRVRIKT